MQNFGKLETMASPGTGELSFGAWFWYWAQVFGVLIFAAACLSNFYALVHYMPAREITKVGGDTVELELPVVVSGPESSDEHEIV
jgi:hypothetical protein